MGREQIKFEIIAVFYLYHSTREEYKSDRQWPFSRLWKLHREWLVNIEATFHFITKANQRNDERAASTSWLQLFKTLRRPNHSCRTYSLKCLGERGLVTQIDGPIVSSAILSSWCGDGVEGTDDHRSSWILCPENWIRARFDLLKWYHCVH